MKNKIKFTKQAIQDLDDIIEYIQADNINTALDIYSKMKKEINDLELFPEKGRIIPELKNHQILLYRELIYKVWRIIYKIEQQQIQIISIIDSRRDFESIFRKNFKQMIIKSQQPNIHLTPYIKEFWILENDSINHTELVYPTGEIQILFHYGKPFQKVCLENHFEKQPQMAICGQNLSYGKVMSEKYSGVVGVVFYPHTAQAFLPLPLDEITNIEVDVTDIFYDWKNYEQKFLDCENVDSKIRLIENFLMQKINIKNQVQFNIIQESINDLKISNGNIQIRDLATRYFISERNYERLFKKSIGLSAKKTADIFKFNNAINLLQKNHSITDISYISGYYDQAHFTKKFKQFTGCTPLQFRKLCYSNN